MRTNTNHINKQSLQVESSIALIAAILAILNSGYYLTSLSDSYLPIIVLIVFSVILILKNRKCKIPININSVLLIILLLGISFASVVNFSINNLLSGFRVAMTILCSYIVFSNVDMSTFIRYYAKAIRVIILLSLVLYLIILLKQSSLFPVIQLKNLSYYNLIIITQNQNSTRANGVFWEPGVFASHIIFVTILDVYFNPNKTKPLNILIYILGIILASSSAGLIIMFIVFIGYVIKRKNLSKNIYIKIFFVVLVLIIAFTYKYIFEGLAHINPTLFSKLVDTNIGTSSTRLNSPLVNLEIFSKKPIFGWGFTDAATQFALKINRGLTSQTSTSTQMLAAIGVLGLAYTGLCVIPIFNKKTLIHLSFIDKFIVVSSVLLIVNKEPHVHFVITWIILFLINNFILIQGEHIDE